MDYVQLPANGFYFVLGIIVGVIGFIIIVDIWAKNIEKKNKEKLTDLFTQLTATNKENKKEERKTKKTDK